MFDRATGAFRHKSEAAVELRLAGDTPVAAAIFHTNGERLTDMLNDPRAFIPIRTAGGAIMIIAKTQIASIIETGSDDHETPNGEDKNRKRFDPFAVLRITPDASLDEIRAAYKARIKAVHPDSIAALDLDPDLEKAALLATQKVNYAYKKILAERQ